MKQIIKLAVLLGICIPLAFMSVVAQIASNILQSTGDAMIRATDVLHRWTDA